MPAAVNLAATTAGGRGATITVTATTPATVTLMRASGAALPGNLVAAVEKLNSSAAWGPTNIVVSAAPNLANGNSGNPISLNAPGQYSVVLPPTAVAVGIDLDQ